MTSAAKPQKPEETRISPACSICGKPVDPLYKPFCSKRCANVDLHRWLNNCYAVAGAPQDEHSADDESEPE